MTDLLGDIKNLLDEAIASERKTMDIYVRLNEASEGLINEKFIDVAGLDRLNFIIFATYIKAHLNELEIIKFHVEMRIADRDKRNSEKKESEWKKLTEKIPQKDEFTLEGIDAWYISHGEMAPNKEYMHSPLFREEAVKLVASGFNLVFNTDHGVGSILVADDGFTIELYKNMKRTTIHKNTMDEVLDWMIYFYES